MALKHPRIVNLPILVANMHRAGAFVGCALIALGLFLSLWAPDFAKLTIGAGLALMSLTGPLRAIVQGVVFARTGRLRAAVGAFVIVAVIVGMIVVRYRQMHGL